MRARGGAGSPHGPARHVPGALNAHARAGYSRWVEIPWAGVVPLILIGAALVGFCPYDLAHAFDAIPE